MLSHPLAQRIADFIETGEGDFESLALDLFKYQYQTNAAYRSFCDSQNQSPQTVQRWEQIPAVPAIAFKRFVLSSAPPESAKLVFHSSGTTQGVPSRHFLDDNEQTLYQLSLWKGFERYALPDHKPLPLWTLIPDRKEAPHSSLAYMASSLQERMPGLPHRCFWQETVLTRELAQALKTQKEPLILFGTAFAFAMFFEESRERFKLPPESVIIETGGLKGRMKEISREDLYSLFEERFGVPQKRCIAEYGMSEMNSQFYDSWLAFPDAPPHKAGVPWCRTRIVDPLTNREVEIGETGQLMHTDLANFNSAMAIKTEDLGVRLQNGFQLAGRAPASEMRGCSLAVEELEARFQKAQV